ncbi:MAG: carboxypeptidase-like regulatory domain-containing protein [Pyrinomonadaceae bacterium]
MGNSLVLIGASIHRAQDGEPISIVRGRVIDEAGALIPDTRLIFTNYNGGEHQMISDGDGGYDFRLPSGLYSVTAEFTKHGAWEKFLVERFEVPHNTMKTFNIVLKVDKKWTDQNGSVLTGSPAAYGGSPQNRTDSNLVNLSGTVFDRMGGVVSGMSVTAIGTDKKPRSFTTNDKGKYSLMLPKGSFSIDVQVRNGQFYPILFTNYRVVENMAFLILFWGMAEVVRTVQNVGSKRSSLRYFSKVRTLTSS